MEQSLVPSLAPDYITNSQKAVSLGQPATQELNLEAWYLGEPQK